MLENQSKKNAMKMSKGNRANKSKVPGKSKAKVLYRNKSYDE